jgi:hypothetical protein
MEFLGVYRFAFWKQRKTSGFVNEGLVIHFVMSGDRCLHLARLNPVRRVCIFVPTAWPAHMRRAVTGDFAFGNLARQGLRIGHDDVSGHTPVGGGCCEGLAL